LRYSLGSGIAVAEVYLKQGSAIAKILGIGHDGITLSPPPYAELCDNLHIGIYSGQGLRWIEFDLQLP
jgi:hypothetical protein